MEAALQTYSGALALNRHSRPIQVASQQVTVQFIELHSGFYLELVAPGSAPGQLAPFMKLGFYHLCFLVPDLSQARTTLRRQRHVALPAFSSEAFDNHQCQFFMNPLGHLIELAEMTPDEFTQWISRPAGLGVDGPADQPAQGNSGG